MTPLIGLAIGIVAGGVQFWLLSKLTLLITGGYSTNKYVLLGLIQLVLPIVVLLAVAFLRRQDLLYTAIGISGTLIVGSVGKYIVATRNKGKGGDNNE